eukprot:TRINITY_DN4546_c0_g1_i2.p1 TRINITY_DN4546_c0_g1~~TRINITY_DN4546_c0_g1_i2.p1  ORF type:complete len:922 (-),score=161.62 TRINITY_DN4546_c0_g1_i2:103-2868(-)
MFPPFRSLTAHLDLTKSQSCFFTYCQSTSSHLRTAASEAFSMTLPYVGFYPAFHHALQSYASALGSRLLNIHSRNIWFQTTSVKSQSNAQTNLLRNLIIRCSYPLKIELSDETKEEAELAEALKAVEFAKAMEAAREREREEQRIARAEKAAEAKAAREARAEEVRAMRAAAEAERAARVAQNGENMDVEAPSSEVGLRRSRRSNAGIHRGREEYVTPGALKTVKRKSTTASDSEGVTPEIPVVSAISPESQQTQTQTEVQNTQEQKAEVQNTQPTEVQTTVTSTQVQNTQTLVTSTQVQNTQTLVAPTEVQAKEGESPTEVSTTRDAQKDTQDTKIETLLPKRTPLPPPPKPKVKVPATPDPFSFVYDPALEEAETTFWGVTDLERENALCPIPVTKYAPLLMTWFPFLRTARLVSADDKMALLPPLLLASRKNHQARKWGEDTFRTVLSEISALDHVKILENLFQYLAPATIAVGETVNMQPQETILEAIQEICSRPPVVLQEEDYEKRTAGAERLPVDKSFALLLKEYQNLEIGSGFFCNLAEEISAPLLDFIFKSIDRELFPRVVIPYLDWVALHFGTKVMVAALIFLVFYVIKKGRSKCPVAREIAFYMAKLLPIEELRETKIEVPVHNYSRLFSFFLIEKDPQIGIPLEFPGHTRSSLDSMLQNIRALHISQALFSFDNILFDLSMSFGQNGIPGGICDLSSQYSSEIMRKFLTSRANIVDREWASLLQLATFVDLDTLVSFFQTFNETLSKKQVEGASVTQLLDYLELLTNCLLFIVRGYRQWGTQEKKNVWMNEVRGLVSRADGLVPSLHVEAFVPPTCQIPCGCHCCYTANTYLTDSAQVSPFVVNDFKQCKGHTTPLHMARLLKPLRDDHPWLQFSSNRTTLTLSKKNLLAERKAQLLLALSQRKADFRKM